MARWKVELARIDVSEDVFEEILRTWKYTTSDNIYSNFYGYEKRLEHRTNLDEYIIVPVFRYNYIMNKFGYLNSIIEDKKDNTQLILRKNINLEKPAPILCGRKAYFMIMKILKKYYNIVEIEEIFRTHSRDYDKNLIQFHYTLPRLENKVYKYTNVVKYDINKAHASAFIKMFPKAEKEFMELVNKGNYYKKIGDEARTLYYKNLFNYAVGYLTKMNYRGTYNYIVQSTTEYLLEAIKLCNGRLIYSNTDSFAVQYPTSLLDTDNNKLGEFKLECNTDIYFYRDTHYFIYEYLDMNNKTVQVGSCLKEIRDKISLKDGLVVKYDVDRSEKYFDNKGKEHVRLHPYNIIQEKINEEII